MFAPLLALILASSFAEPPREAGMSVYWIWFGPAQTREGIDSDLADMRASHISGTVLLPVYPLALDGNYPFLSPRFLDILRYTAAESRRLGLTFDVTVGTGWPYGGPWITRETSARMIRLRPAGEQRSPGEEVVATFGDRAVVSMPTGMVVKRAAIGDEGLVLDHYSRRALETHLDAAGEKLWGAVKDSGIRSFWCDSLEVFQANWTPGFLEEFSRRRGYDLKPLLPLLFGEATLEARHVRRDFWRTLSEAAADNFVRPLQEWCHRKGVELQMESYGQPPVNLASFRYVDRPVGEHYEWRMFNASRWAASGGRLYGKNVIGAEAWTWTGIPNRFADSLEQLKLASDMHFVSGINSLMGISFVSSPPEAGRPGWVPYWGPVINRNQPWWPYFPLFARYVQRASDVLRQGRPVADVALYLPIDDVYAATSAASPLNLYFGARDRMHGKPAPEFGLRNAIAADTPVISAILRAGYSFDGIDSSTLPEARIENGRLKMGLGDYRVVVLPNLDGMPAADLDKLAAFARAGGTVIATRRMPEIAWGWQDRRRSLAPPPAFVLAASEGAELRAALHRAVPADLALEREDPDIGFVHRQTPDGDLYFIANLGAEPKSLGATFRAGTALETWDLMTGKTERGWDGTLRLDPYGSVVVRTGRATAKPQPRREPERMTEITNWTLERHGKLDRLVSWTQLSGLQHFSGSLAYTAEFDAPAAAAATLDLGDVREIADVSINGKPAGVAWKRPYRIDVTALFRPGRNTVRVVVTNLWINEILGAPPPDYRELNAKFGARFPDPSEWKSAAPLPSGLLGPTRLLTSPSGNRTP